MKALLSILFAFATLHAFSQSPVSIQAIVGGQAYDFGGAYELPDSVLRQPFEIRVLNLNPDNGMVYCFRQYSLVLDRGVGAGTVIKMPLNNKKIEKQSDCSFDVNMTTALNKQNHRLIVENVYVMNSAGKKKLLNLPDRSRYINLKGI